MSDLEIRSWSNQYAAEFDEGRRIHGHLEDLQGLESVETRDAIVDVFVSAALIRLYGLCGDIETAQRVFDEFAKGLKAPNAMLQSFLMEAYAANGDMDECLRLFEELEREGVSNTLTFTVVLRACAKSGRLEYGQMIYDRLKGGKAIDERVEKVWCECDYANKAN